MSNSAADKLTHADSKRRRDELNRRIHRLHHGVLEKNVLRGALPVRARTLPYRCALPDVRERERRFRDVCPPYVEALQDSESFGRSTRVTTLDGLTWWVPLTRPDDAAHVERTLHHQDFPYRTIAQTRELALGGAMIDIGANTGRMCIPRVILGDVTTAYCAEPDPLNYTCLVRNVRDKSLRGLILPDRIAVGSEDGTVRLRRAKSPGGHKVIDPGTASKHEIIEVSCLTLDTWIDRIGIDLEQLAFVKVDTQGSEVHVLRGASRVLECKHVAWQLEVNAELLDQRGFRPRDLFGMLREHFTHFIDLGRNAMGERLRPIGEMADVLACVTGATEGRTDVLVFTLDAAVTSG